MRIISSAVLCALFLFAADFAFANGKYFRAASAMAWSVAAGFGFR